MSGTKRLERSRVSQRGMALLAAYASAFIASATVHAASSASFFDVQVTVVRSCRISTDSLDVDRTPLGTGCASGAAATPQIDLAPTPPGEDPVRWTAEGLIASLRPAGVPERRVQPTTLRLTINF